jgi:glycosyltransferase involved in cell wall biosynthesis
MKIAHVAPEYFPTIGGVGQVVRELAERQVSQGHDVSVFVPDWDKYKRIKKKHETINGVKVYRCYHLFRVANFNTIWPSALIKLINGNFDIIHSHNFGHLHVFISALASKLSKAKHIHTTHCPWSDAKRSFIGNIGLYISYNIFSRWALHSADKVIAITPWEISYIQKYSGIKSNIFVIPNGVGSEFFTKLKNNDFKKSHDIKGKMVLFFGRLNQVKSPDFFAELASEITKKRKDLSFAIIGPDEGLLEKVKKIVSENKLIHIIPPLKDRKEVIKMYQSSEVYVLPSYREGLPLTIFEAMASGLPIVATPVNGIPYEIKDKKNGFLVKYGDKDKFIEKILELIDNSSLHKRISLENIKKSKNYNWDTINQKTLKLYHSAIASKLK